MDRFGEIAKDGVVVTTKWEGVRSGATISVYWMEGEKSKRLTGIASLEPQDGKVIGRNHAGDIIITLDVR